MMKTMIVFSLIFTCIQNLHAETFSDQPYPEVQSTEHDWKVHADFDNGKISCKGNDVMNQCACDLSKYWNITEADPAILQVRTGQNSAIFITSYKTNEYCSVFSHQQIENIKWNKNNEVVGCKVNPLVQDNSESCAYSNY
jgi:hypothetical protein